MHRLIILKKNLTTVVYKAAFSIECAYSVSNATQPLYPAPADREMSSLFDFSSSDTDLSQERRSNDRVAASFDRTTTLA